MRADFANLVVVLGYPHAMEMSRRRLPLTVKFGHFLMSLILRRMIRRR